MQHFEIDQINQDAREETASAQFDAFVEQATDEILSGLTQQLINSDVLKQYVREFAEAMRVDENTCVENFAFDFKQTHFMGL